MPKRLTNATITHVSLVDKGANGKSFAIIKSEDQQPTFEKRFNLIVKNVDEQIVTGVVYEPNVEDSHGDYMTSEDIEKSAHTFLKEYRQVDKQHNWQGGFGDVVESYVAKSDMEIEGETITKGTWLMSVHVTDNDTWESIKKGEITGFSMGGVGEYITEEDPIEKSFMDHIKKFFTGNNVKKGAVLDQYNKNVKSENFWTAFYALRSTLVSYDWSNDETVFESDQTKVREALTDFNLIIESLLLTDNVFKAMGQPTEDITKAGKKISTANSKKIQTAIDYLQELVATEGEAEVTKEEMQAVLKEALAPVTDRLEKLEKEEGGEITPPVVEEPKQTNEEIAKMMGEVVKEALEPITKRLETVENTRQVAKSQEPPAGQEPVTKSVWNGLF